MLFGKYLMDSDLSLSQVSLPSTENDIKYLLPLSRRRNLFLNTVIWHCDLEDLFYWPTEWKRMEGVTDRPLESLVAFYQKRYKIFASTLTKTVFVFEYSLLGSRSRNIFWETPEKDLNFLDYFELRTWPVNDQKTCWKPIAKPSTAIWPNECIPKFISL